MDWFESIGVTALQGSYIRENRGIPPDLLLAAAVTADASRLNFLERGKLEFPEFKAAVERIGISEFVTGDKSEEELRGLLTAVRGAVGEHWVYQGLHNGSLPVPAGTSRIDLLPFHTPGVDLQFTGSTGQMVATANVKIAKSAQVIAEHFERHPDVKLVYASSDAAEHASRLGWAVVDNLDGWDPNKHLVVDIGQSSRDFDRELSWVMDHGDGHFSAGDVLTNLPWIAVSAVALRAIMRFRRGHPPARVIRRATEEGVVVGGSAALTSIASKITVSEPILMATAFLGSTFGFGILRGRESWLQAGDSIERAARNAEHLALRYGARHEDR